MVAYKAISSNHANFVPEDESMPLNEIYQQSKRKRSLSFLRLERVQSFTRYYLCCKTDDGVVFIRSFDGRGGCYHRLL